MVQKSQTMKAILLFFALCSVAVFSKSLPKLELADQVELDAFENELAGMLSGILSGQIE